MNVYSIAKGVKPEQFHGSHATAVLKAMEVLKKPATASEIIAYVKKHRLLRKSQMDASRAVRWIFSWLKRQGAVVVKEGE
jgi:hypothetical protein